MDALCLASDRQHVLVKGRRYEVEILELLGWTDGDGSGIEGYNFETYFDATGAYLGPDEHGIEPLFDNIVRA